MVARPKVETTCKFHRVCPLLTQFSAVRQSHSAYKQDSPSDRWARQFETSSLSQVIVSVDAVACMLRTDQKNTACPAAGSYAKGIGARKVTFNL